MAYTWARRASLPLALVGLALSVYLTWVHYTEPTSLSCPSTGAVNCTKVTTSDQSMLFGFFPVALAGALYFLAMTALVLPRAWRSRSVWVERARLGGAVAGVGMILWLIYAEVLILHAICLWCTAVHVVGFLLFVAVLTATLLKPWDDAVSADGTRRARPVKV